MHAIWVIIAATCLAPAANPDPADELLKDGWKKVVPIPSPLLGEGDQYVVWVEKGWLQARRETAAGEIDWQIVLARATEPKPPTVSAPKGTFRFEVSYREGRYFVREDANILRCLREHKPDDSKAWPAVPFKADKFLQGTSGPRLGLWHDKSWYFVAARPNKDQPDCLVRIGPLAHGEQGTGFEGTNHSQLAKVSCGERNWVIDDGDLFIAQRTVAALYKAELKVGDTAPPFTAKDLDGKPIALEDYRGKYVLLDFWATWCGPCIAEIPHLKSIHKEFNKDKRFAMMSLCLDDEIEAPINFLRDQNISWPQVFLGNSSESKAAKDYNAQTIPFVLLIGPDGKIIALGLRGKEIKAAIAKVLGTP
ncbi:MAG: hypothetical protein NVSMB14_04080 [Isosphaeraceae bacterium]